MSFEPNGFGLHQMHGNVSEWCEDYYDPEFYSKPAATERDPVNTVDVDGRRVLRGGSWRLVGRVARSAYRDRLGAKSEYSIQRRRAMPLGGSGRIRDFSGNGFRPICRLP